MATITGTNLRNIINGTSVTDLINGLAGNDDLFGLAGNDRLLGGVGDDKLFGGAGADQLLGEDGNDLLDGGVGSDTMVGGRGNDVYVVDVSPDRAIELAGVGTGIDLVKAGASYSLGANVENLILTGALNINGTGNTLGNVMTGNAARNILRGLTGNDNINGLAGNDTIDGGVGNDRMAGGIGNDTYVVNSTGDVVVELANQGTDALRSTVTKILPANVENLVLLGAASISGTGNALANIITGNGGNNTLDGLGGVDRMIGGLGNDIYFVDHISDLVTEGGNAGTDTVRSTVSETLSLNVENLTLLGALASRQATHWLTPSSATPQPTRSTAWPEWM